MSSANYFRIKEAPVNQRIQARCVVRDVSLKYTAQGKPYLELEIGDASGRLKARLWEKFEKWQRLLKPGVIVQLECTPYLYQKRKELKIHRIAIDRNSSDYSEFLPHFPGDKTALIQQFEGYVQQIRDPHWSSLLQQAFENESMLQKYYTVPGGKLWHHVYLGGLLHHVVGMLQLADALCEQYSDLNRELLQMGIIFHDIGKLWSFDYSQGFIEYSTEGRLIGHVVLGSAHVTRLMQSLPDLPKAYKLSLQHLIVSHPGHLEDGAPVVPQTREAVALWLLNEMDKKMNAVTRILDNDVFTPEGWSKFSPLLNRFLFKGFNLNLPQETTMQRNAPEDNENSD